MQTLNDLNTYSGESIQFNVTNAPIGSAPLPVLLQRAVGDGFYTVSFCWIAVQQLGPMSGTGVRIIHDITASPLGTTVTYPLAGGSINPLTITNPSTNIWQVDNIKNVTDFQAATAYITPPVDYLGNVHFECTILNSNGSTIGNFVIPLAGVPVA